MKTQVNSEEKATYNVTNPQISKDTIIKVRSVISHDVTRDESINTDYANVVRIYRYSPDTACLQLRSFGPTNDRRNGVPKHILTSTDTMTSNQLRELAAAAVAIADDLDRIAGTQVRKP